MQFPDSILCMYVCVCVYLLGMLIVTVSMVRNWVFTWEAQVFGLLVYCWLFRQKMYVSLYNEGNIHEHISNGGCSLNAQCWQRSEKNSLTIEIEPMWRKPEKKPTVVVVTKNRGKRAHTHTTISICFSPPIFCSWNKFRIFNTIKCICINCLRVGRIFFAGLPCIRL